MKKAKLLIGLLGATLGLSAASAIVFTRERSVRASGGSGTIGDPYLVSTADEFQSMLDLGTDGTGQYFKLANDLNYTISASPTQWFYGHFDGDNHKITISMSQELRDTPATRVSLFYGINSKGEVANLVTDGELIGANNVAPITLYCNGDVKNCTNYATVTASGNYVGGIVSILSWESKSKDDVYSNVEGCVNHGSVYSSSGFGVGGIVGFSYSFGHIRNSTNLGTVRSDHDNTESSNSAVGGILGQQNLGKTGIVISDCVNGDPSDSSIGKIIGTASIGGIAGYFPNGTADLPFHVTDCINYAEIDGLKSSQTQAYAGHIGGIIGCAGQFTFATRCSNFGPVSGRGRVASSWRGVGGVAGSAYASSEYVDCYNGGDIRATVLAGGVLGFANSALTMNDCFNAGSVVSEAATAYAGGLSAYAGAYTVSGLVSAGSVSSTAANPTNVSMTAGNKSLNATVYDTPLSAAGLSLIREVRTFKCKDAGDALGSRVSSLLGQLTNNDQTILSATSFVKNSSSYLDTANYMVSYSKYIKVNGAFITSFINERNALPIAIVAISSMFVLLFGLLRVHHRRRRII